MIFEKLGSLAKNAANKTEDAIEIAKLNSKINAENNKISAVKMHIGEYCWARFTAGASLDEEIMNLCNRIEDLLKNIATAEAEIQSIKSAATMSSISYSQTQSKSPTLVCKEETETEISCSNDEVIDVDTSVNKVDGSDEIKNICSNCGMEITDPAKFCPSCGTKLNNE